MASTINASSTANGIVSTADASGILNVQSNGVNTNAQAWVNFNGSTAAIRASYNVSSITKNGTGDYTVNFTNAFADTNYVAVLSSGTVETTCNVASRYSTGATTSSLRVFSETANEGALIDITTYLIAVFR